MAVKSNATGAAKMDATEAALSAIEDALNLSTPDQPSALPKSRRPHRSLFPEPQKPGN